MQYAQTCHCMWTSFAVMALSDQAMGQAVQINNSACTWCTAMNNIEQVPQTNGHQMTKPPSSRLSSSPKHQRESKLVSVQHQNSKKSVGTLTFSLCPMGCAKNSHPKNESLGGSGAFHPIPGRSLGSRGAGTSCAKCTDTGTTGERQWS